MSDIADDDFILLNYVENQVWKWSNRKYPDPRGVRCVHDMRKVSNSREYFLNPPYDGTRRGRIIPCYEFGDVVEFGKRRLGDT